MGAESFHGNRVTDMMKLTAAFHNFANVPKDTQRILVGKTFRR